MDFSRLFTSWGSVSLVLISTIVIYLVVVGYTRLAGPRSLATMSSFDFAATIAIGSTLATVANLGTPLAHGVVTLAVLYLAQTGMAYFRRRRDLARALDNRPLLLMQGAEVLEGNLRTARITRSELLAQLRSAGVTRLEEVGAAVLETTGSVSVLKVDPGGVVDDVLLEEVRR